MLTLGTILSVFLIWPFFGPENQQANDTLRIETTGCNNRVLVNQREGSTSFFTNDSIPVSGVITQAGVDNNVKIQTGNPQKTKQQNVQITQTGKNNTVKINSQ